MARPIWKGNISFGLVSIPVGIYPAEDQKEELAFRMLDRRNLSPVKNERVNERTGKDVPWEEVVKGYEYEDGKYVVLSDQDFRRANVEATRTIDIVDFVDADKIDILYYDKPYYLAPGKGAAKAYALLREALRRAGKVGIARVVIRTRQHVAALLPRGAALILEILRYSYELRDEKDLDLPSESLSALGVRKNELELADQLVKSMSATWSPKKYHDEYREDLLRLVKKKIKAGRTKVIDDEPEEEPEEKKGGEVIDIMSLLQQSLDKKKRPRTATRKAPLRRTKAAHAKKSA